MREACEKMARECVNGLHRMIQKMVGSTPRENIYAALQTEEMEREMGESSIYNRMRQYVTLPASTGKKFAHIEIESRCEKQKDKGLYDYRVELNVQLDLNTPALFEKLVKSFFPFESKAEKKVEEWAQSRDWYDWEKHPSFQSIMWHSIRKMEQDFVLSSTGHKKASRSLLHALDHGVLDNIRSMVGPNSHVAESARFAMHGKIKDTCSWIKLRNSAGGPILHVQGAKGLCSFE